MNWGEMKRMGRLSLSNIIMTERLLKMEIGHTFALASPDGARIFKLIKITKHEDFKPRRTIIKDDFIEKIFKESLKEER